MREEMPQNEGMVGDSIQLSHHSRQGQSSFCLTDHGRTSSNEGMKSCTTVIFSDTHKLSGRPAGAPSSEGTVMEHFPQAGLGTAPSATPLSVSGAGIILALLPQRS